jgi:hypothetical protein
MYSSRIRDPKFADPAMSRQKPDAMEFQVKFAPYSHMLVNGFTPNGEPNPPNSTHLRISWAIGQCMDAPKHGRLPI